MWGQDAITALRLRKQLKLAAAGRRSFFVRAQELRGNRGNRGNRKNPLLQQMCARSD
jgi:hypothetical protein